MDTLWLSNINLPKTNLFKKIHKKLFMYIDSFTNTVAYFVLLYLYSCHIRHLTNMIWWLEVIYYVHCPLIFNTFGEFSDETVIANVQFVRVFW